MDRNHQLKSKVTPEEFASFLLTKFQSLSVDTPTETPQESKENKERENFLKLFQFKDEKLVAGFDLFLKIKKKNQRTLH